MFFWQLHQLIKSRDLVSPLEKPCEHNVPLLLSPYQVREFTYTAKRITQTTCVQPGFLQRVRPGLWLHQAPTEPFPQGLLPHSDGMYGFPGVALEPLLTWDLNSKYLK